MQNVVGLNEKNKNEIAQYIYEANIAIVNSSVPEVQVKKSFYVKYGKRMFDFTIALVAVIVTAPINIVIAIVTFFDVGFPIIYKQQRTGKDKKIFTIYKFRNMTNETDMNGELLPPEKRVTKWGRFVRKTSLDELLNFISVLKGDMSLVGPRPLLNDYVELYNDYHMRRFEYRPGLECPSIKKLDHVMDWQERLDNDIWYVQNCSFLVDLKMIFRIVQVALNRKAIKTRGNANAGRFLGYDKDGSIITSHAVPDEFCEMFCEKHGFSSIEEVIISYQRKEEN